MIHIPRLYWAGFFYALYNRPVLPCRGLFIMGGIPIPGYYMGLCGLLWAYIQGLYIRGFIL
nr:MAG TPA: hypothetical protein [Caudoviricetes sp.]